MSRPAEHPCGFAATCGRAAGHSGHHGGWRSGIKAQAADPVMHHGRGRDVAFGSELGPADLKVLTEFVHHANIKQAAACIGMAVQTFKNHMAIVHQRIGSTNVVEACTALGWLVVPPNVGSKHVSLEAAA